MRSKQSPGSLRIRHQPKSNSRKLRHVARYLTPKAVMEVSFHELHVTRCLLYCETVSATRSSWSKLSQKSAMRNTVSLYVFLNAQLLAEY